MKKIILLIIAIIGVIPATCLRAQLEEGQSLDKPVAIVGREIILKSDVDAQMLYLKQQDPSVDLNDREKRDQILDLLIDENLVIMKAMEDTTVNVTDDEIDQRWELQLAQYVQMYGSEKRIEDLYGKSIETLKFQFRDIIRKKLLSEKLQMKVFGNVTVTPRELEEFYEHYRDSLPPIPARVELLHIVKEVEAMSDEKENLRKLAKEVRDSILEGGDFADFAKRYSGDVYSGAKGGDLGWVKKGKLYPEFEKAAFNLQKGQISLPVETPFGFHVIQTIDKNKDAVNVRHILFKFGDQDKNKKQVLEFLTDLKKKVIEGESFEDLARQYSDDKQSKGFGGAIGGKGKFNMPLSPVSMSPNKYVPSNLNEIVKNMKVGEVSDPLPYADEPNLALRIIYKKSYTPEHKAKLDEDYDELKEIAIKYKQHRLQAEWLQGLRDELYWEKRTD